MVLLRGGVPAYPNVGDAIDAGRAGAVMFGSSAFAALLVQVSGIWNGVEGYLLGVLSGRDGLAEAVALVLMAVLAWPVHVVVCVYVASYLVPRREYARVLAPLVNSPVPPSVPLGRVFGAAAFSSLILFVLYPSLVVLAEEELRKNPAIQKQLEQVEIVVEQVDDILCAGAPSTR